MKELFSLCFLVILLGTAFPAIIITQSIPGVIKISPNKYIITIDQPNDISYKLATSGPKKQVNMTDINHHETTVVQTSKNKTQTVEESAQISQMLSITELYDSKSAKNDGKVSGAVKITPNPTPSIATTPRTTSSTTSTPFITASSSTSTQTPPTSSADKKVTSSAPAIGLANPKSR